MNELILLIGAILFLVLSGVLNRLRGTGLIKHFGVLHLGKYSIEIKLVWNHIYAIYFGSIFGYLASSVVISILIVIAYFIGESKGWGEWIGALTTNDIKDQEWLDKQYKDDEGKNFPFIHQITNSIIPEQIEGTLEDKIQQHTKYSVLALVLRGIYWFLPMVLITIFAGLISWYFGLISLVLIGISFPLACWLGKITNINGKLGVVSYSRGWENQEIYYGCMHFIFIILPIFYGI